MSQAVPVVDHPSVQRARIRAKTEAAIDQLSAIMERLIAALDEADAPAAELEPNGDDEPSLGWPIGSQHGGGSTDLPTLDCERDDADREETLGFTEAIDQTRHQFGADDKEPSLGALQTMDQTRWGDHLNRRQWQTIDGEDQCEDEGWNSDDEGHAQATCQHFRDGDGRQTWPPSPS